MSDSEVLKEIGKLLIERQRKSEEVAAIDRKIEELAGVSKKSTYKKKTLSSKDMRAACGVA
jgi:hypothetical protein